MVEGKEEGRVGNWGDSGYELPLKSRLVKGKAMGRCRGLHRKEIARITRRHRSVLPLGCQRLVPEAAPAEQGLGRLSTARNSRSVQHALSVCVADPDVDPRGEQLLDEVDRSGARCDVHRTATCRCKKFSLRGESPVSREREGLFFHRFSGGENREEEAGEKLKGKGEGRRDGDATVPMRAVRWKRARKARQT